MPPLLLRRALLANASFSAASGLIMVAAHSVLGNVLGPDVPAVYLLLGLGLLSFATGLAWLAARPRPLWVLGVVAADVGWIVGTTVLLAIFWADFEVAGVLAVAATNGVVALLVVYQLRGLSRTFSVTGEPGRYEICVRVATHLPRERLWPVVADLGRIDQHLQDLRSSRMEGDAAPGEGAVRTCENRRGQRWSERCIEWREGSSFDVRFLTDRPGFPFPFSDMVGGWRLVPTDAGCDVEVWWRVVPTRPWLAPLLLPVMARGASGTFEAVVASMVAQAEGRPAGEAPQLRAAFC
ncbi:MAG: SRPBCC family protein [Myxococcota bacterium]